MTLKQKKEMLKSNPAIAGARIGYGALYGLLVGVAFAFSTWASDGYLLSKAHALMPWLKLLLGVILCGLAGIVAGWMTIRFNRWGISLSGWLGLSVFFSWLVIALPMQISPMVAEWLNPQLSDYIHIKTFGDVSSRFWLAFMWIVIFVSIVGVLESVLVDSIIFAPTIVGRITPVAVCILILGVCGSITDGLSNEPLRFAILGMDSTIQFVVEHQGQDVNQELARENHTGALRAFTDDISDSRKLFISGYDVQLGEVHVMVMFEGITLDCIVLYGQTSYCVPPS